MTHEYDPVANKNREMNLTAVLSVDAAMMKPIRATTIPRVMWKVLSLRRPEDQASATEKTPAHRYGGQVMTRVIVVLYPRVLTTVGKNELKPHAAR